MPPKAMRGPVIRRLARDSDEVFDAEVAGAKLSAALGAMSTAERCEAVVLSALGRGEFDEALMLLEEEPRGLTSRVASDLITNAIRSRDARKVQRALSFRNKFKSYSCEQAGEPVADSRRRARLLLSEKETNTDERVLEITAAVGTVGTALSAIATVAVDTVAGINPIAPDAVILGLAVIGGLDVWKNDAKATALVGSGISRLAVDDARREAESEAAAFLIGYLLGVPAFAFKPTAFEAFKLLVDPELPSRSLPPAPVLAWLAAPIAAESNNHRKLVVSDPRQLLAAIQLAADRGVFDDASSLNISHVDRLRWATRQARSLLTNYAQLHRVLSDSFEARSASPADCVAIIESWS